MTFGGGTRGAIPDEGTQSCNRRLRRSEKNMLTPEGSHDFGEGALNGAFGYQVLEKRCGWSHHCKFKLNAEAFPQSGNVWDSLAEAYMKAGDVKKAEEKTTKNL